MSKHNPDSEPPAKSKDIPSSRPGMQLNPKSPTFGHSSPATGSDADQEQNTLDTPLLHSSAILVARDSPSNALGSSDRRSQFAFPASVPAMEFHESLPTDVTAVEEAEIDLSMHAWGQLDGVTWMAKLREAVKSIVYAHCIQFSRFLKIYEKRNKQHYKRYLEIKAAMDQMWDSWVKCAAHQRIGMEDLQACQILFDYSCVLPNIVAPLKSSAAVRESTCNIRQALVELNRTVVLLQGVIIDATCREEENYGTSGPEIEKDLETEQDPELHPSPSSALNSSAPTPAGRSGAGRCAAGNRGSSESGEHGFEGCGHLVFLERLY